MRAEVEIKIHVFHHFMMSNHSHSGMQPPTLITVCISSYFLHCHSLVVGDRGVGATECLCNFTLERKRQHRQTSEHPKSPFYISVSERGDPTHCQALQREQKKTANHVYLSTQLRFHFERLWAGALTLKSACCRAAFKENNAWFFFFSSPYLASVSQPAISSSTTRQAEMKRCWTFKWLYSIRPLLLHFVTQEVWCCCILFIVLVLVVAGAE